jgi:hypothetical protein
VGRGEEGKREKEKKKGRRRRKKKGTGCGQYTNKLVVKQTHSSEIGTNASRAD